MDYAELRCRTHYTFLTGGSHPSELIGRAAELGLSALAITDLNGVYGIPKAYLACKSLPSPSKLKLITGAELTLEDHPPLTLLAQDRQGYGLLCRMITASHADRPKGEPALPWSEFLKLMERPGTRSLTALPTFGEGDIKSRFRELRDLFEDRLYLPVSRFLDGHDQERLERALELSAYLGSKIVATNEVHYHVPERRRLQDVLTSIREGIPLARIGRKVFSNAERYLKGPTQMAELFRDFPQAVTNTLEVAERCRFSPAELRYRYPSEWIPAGETAQSYLAGLVWQGARRRYGGTIPDDVRRQLEHELKLINELKFADYFLTIWEIVEFAREKKILCQGRGSAANSAVCYCLGITAVDPVRMNLLFERFISAERGEPPDIDVDFEHERREEVIQHLYRKYGRDRAAMVAAVITYRSRSCRREIAKALSIPQEQAAEHPPEHPLLQALTEELYGFPRHLSIHSGGFTLSADPIIETVPVEPARMEGRTIVQWDKYDLDTLGLLKVDVLSLGMLSALRKTLDRVGLSLYSIPPDDPETYAMMRRADTVGVFQIESRAQMSMLPRLLPRNFYDLVVQVAIVRPGPIQGKMVHPYLRRKKGLEPVVIPHEKLKPILERTLGVPLFQEQVMKMAIALAGFTPGEADELRRAIGAWRSSGSIQKIGKKLMQGLRSSGLSEEFTQRIFQQIQGFAEYGFPESHAASFALIAYSSAYLKCHFPAEFTCALVNSQPMGFYSNHSLIDDAKRHGVPVLPVHPNLSTWDCQIEKTSEARSAIRIGWRVVHGMSQEEAEAIVAERIKRPFSNLRDFLSRCPRLRSNVLHTLAMGDTFRSFGVDRRPGLYAGLHNDGSPEASPSSPVSEVAGCDFADQRHALWEILEFQLAYRSDQHQLNLFSSPRECLSAAESPPRGEALFSEMTEYEQICADYASFGLSTRGHPMQALRRKLPPALRQTTRQAKATPHGKSILVPGLVIVRQRPSTAKGVTFATLEDETGFLDLILKAEVYEEYRDTLNSNPFLAASGMIQRDGNSVSMLVKTVRPLPLEEVSRELPARAHDYH